MCFTSRKQYTVYLALFVRRKQIKLGCFATMRARWQPWSLNLRTHVDFFLSLIIFLILKLFGLLSGRSKVSIGRAKGVREELTPGGSGLSLLGVSKGSCEVKHALSLALSSSGVFLNLCKCSPLQVIGSVWELMGLRSEGLLPDPDLRRSFPTRILNSYTSA